MNPTKPYPARRGDRVPAIRAYLAFLASIFDSSDDGSSARPRLQYSETPRGKHLWVQDGGDRGQVAPGFDPQMREMTNAAEENPDR